MIMVGHILCHPWMDPAQKSLSHKAFGTTQTTLAQPQHFHFFIALLTTQKHRDHSRFTW